MMKRASLFMLSSIASLVTAETLDFGRLDQYQGRTTAIPSLSGNTIWASGHTGDGYDVALSADAAAQVQGALEGCDALLDGRCHAAVLGVLEAAHLQVDSQTEPRDFLALLDATFRTRGGFLAFYAGLLQSLWADARPDEVRRPKHFPAARAGAAALLATAVAPVTVTAANVTAWTVTAWTLTPTPMPTKVQLQGAITPQVTPYPTPTQAFAKEDVAAPEATQYVARLDADLASQIDAAMRSRGDDCADGRAFDAAVGGGNGGPQARRQTTSSSSSRSSSNNNNNSTSYGAAICGAEALGPMVAVGGPFNDLLLLGSDSDDAATPALAFRTPAAERAAAVARAFYAEAAAGPLGLDAGLARRLGTFLFALAVDALVEDRALGAENPIDATVAVRVEQV